MGLDEAIVAYEKELISDALKMTNGNQTKAARLLHTTERIIGYKIKKHKIDTKRYK
jgi:Nif-specific regulatory protein